MIDAPDLVSIDAAKLHLRELSNVDRIEEDVQSKLTQATAFVLRQCGPLADAAWTQATVPAPVHTAILMHLAELYTDRGDGERSSEPFGSLVARYLMASGYRDPVLA